MDPDMVIKDKELVQRLESEWQALPSVRGQGVGVGKAAPAADRGAGKEGTQTGEQRKKHKTPTPPFSTTASMIHWTRQIKEVLSAQESVETGENLGPLEEIEFWHNRCMDLSGISKQLVKKGVKHIESILFLAKSSYLTPFRKLAQQIQVEWIRGPGLIKHLGSGWGGGKRSHTRHRWTKHCGLREDMRSV